MNRKQVIDDFAHCCHGDCYICGAGPKCKYIDHTVEGGLAMMPIRLVRGEVLTLLKEQEPVKHGRWIKKSEESLWPIGHCSCCGKLSMGTEKCTYCPNCGAKMNLGEEDEQER